MAWLLGLERDGVLLLSGPLTSGEGVGPGSGVTVLRAAGAEEALAIARQDPFALAGLREARPHDAAQPPGTEDADVHGQRSGPATTPPSARRCCP